MTDSELLLEISNIIDIKNKGLVQALDVKFQSIEDELKRIRIDMENDVKPNIKTLAEHYLPAADDFTVARMSIEDIQKDIELMKKVLKEHSEKLQKIS